MDAGPAQLDEPVQPLLGDPRPAALDVAPGERVGQRAAVEPDVDRDGFGNDPPLPPPPLLCGPPPGPVGPRSPKSSTLTSRPAMICLSRPFSALRTST